MTTRPTLDSDLVATLLDGVNLTPLLAPVEPVAGLWLRNRFVMAPMTRGFSPGGIPGADVAAYYARRASSIGMIITEGVYVDERSAGTSDRVPRFGAPGAVEAWRRVTDGVHAVGGRIAAQLWHLGAARTAGAPPFPDAPVVSPSGIGAAGQHVGEPASLATIDGIVDAFVRAARDARSAGFDGVEVHGAHGYLLDQFCWSRTNHRTDRYGGDLAGRVRLGAEVVAAIRDAVGPDYPILYRFSQWKGGYWDARLAETPAELEALLTPLADAGVDIFHASTRRFWLPAFAGSARTLAGWTRDLTGRPAIAVGSVGVVAPFRGTEAEGQRSLSLAPLLRAFALREFDLIAVGRALLADPDWLDKLVAGQPGSIRPYTKESERTLW